MENELSPTLNPRNDNSAKTGICSEGKATEQTIAMINLTDVAQPATNPDPVVVVAAYSSWFCLCSRRPTDGHDVVCRRRCTFQVIVECLMVMVVAKHFTQVNHVAREVVPGCENDRPTRC